MQIASLQSVPVQSVPTTRALGLAQDGASIPGERFTDLVTKLLNGVANSQQAADRQVLDLVTGKAENLHDVTLQIANADLQFRLALEIRNRVLEAYQEIQRMQF